MFLKNMWHQVGTVIKKAKAPLPVSWGNNGQRKTTTSVASARFWADQRARSLNYYYTHQSPSSSYAIAPWLRCTPLCPSSAGVRAASADEASVVPIEARPIALPSLKHGAKVQSVTEQTFRFQV